MAMIAISKIFVGKLILETMSRCAVFIVSIESSALQPKMSKKTEATARLMQSPIIAFGPVATVEQLAIS